MSSSELIIQTLVLVPIDAPHEHSHEHEQTGPQQGLAYGHGGGHTKSNSKSHSHSKSKSKLNGEEIDPEFERRPPMMLSYPSPSKNPMNAIYMHDPTSRDHPTKYQSATTLALGRNISTRIYDVKLSRRLATVEFRDPPIPGLTGRDDNDNDNDDIIIPGDGDRDGHEHGDESNARAKVILKVNQSNIHHKFNLNGNRVILEEVELEDGDEISLHGDKYMYQVHILESRARARTRGTSRKARGTCNDGNGNDHGHDAPPSRQKFSADASTVHSGDAASAADAALSLAPASILPCSGAITNVSTKELLKMGCEKQKLELKMECMKAEGELKMESKFSPSSPSLCTSTSTSKRPRDEQISSDDAAALLLAKTESTASATASAIKTPISTVETDKIQQVARQQILDEVSCPICMEIIVHAHVANPCGHIFCKTCIKMVYKEPQPQPQPPSNPARTIFNFNGGQNTTTITTTNNNNHDRSCPSCRKEIESISWVKPVDNLIWNNILIGDIFGSGVHGEDDLLTYMERSGKKIKDLTEDQRLCIFGKSARLKPSHDEDYDEDIQMICIAPKQRQRQKQRHLSSSRSQRRRLANANANHSRAHAHTPSSNNTGGDILQSAGTRHDPICL